MHLYSFFLTAFGLPTVFARGPLAERVAEQATPTSACSGAPIDGYGPIPTGLGWNYEWGCNLKHRPKNPVFEFIHYHDCQKCYQPEDRFDNLGGWEEHAPPESLCKPLPRGPLWPQLIRYTYKELNGKANCQTMHLRDSKFSVGGGWKGDDDQQFHKIIFHRVRKWDKDGIEKQDSPVAQTCKVSVYPLGDYSCEGEPVAVFGDGNDRKCLEVTGQNVKVECTMMY